MWKSVPAERNPGPEIRAADGTGDDDARVDCVAREIDVLSRRLRGMRELTTDIDIDAPPETVWRVLADFDHYPAWNPFMRVLGRPNRGARLVVDLSPPGARQTRFRPTVTHVERGRELRWRGHLFVTGLYDGEHRFRIESREDGGSRFVQAESFSGLLVGPINRFVGDATRRGFEAMNAALKTRAESLALAERNGELGSAVERENRAHEVEPADVDDNVAS